jgi:methylated-DNA-protein-cysteine methyltransferase-like protein
VIHGTKIHPGGKLEMDPRPRSTLARLRTLISTVPRGKVVTYGQVADAGGFPRAARVTVWALQKGDGLPWHRVVAAGGRIALQGAARMEQRLRLEVEGVTFRGDRVRMDLHQWAFRSGRVGGTRTSPQQSARSPGRRSKQRSDSGVAGRLARG